MPAVGFICTRTGKNVSFEDAPFHFEAQGVMPQEAVDAVMDDLGDDRRKGPYLSASKLDGNFTCRREVVIHQFMDYYLEPLVLWEAVEGQLWHRVLRELGRAEERDWLSEVELPGKDPDGWRKVAGLTELDRKDVSLKKNEYSEDHWLYEMWPGVFLSGRLDRVHPDQNILVDLKTTRYPWTRRKGDDPYDYGPRDAKDKWPLQTSAYAELSDVFLGTNIDKMFVWRSYRGSHRRDKTWKRFPIERLTKEDLWQRIEKHVTTTVEFLEKANAVRDEPEALQEVVKGIPMDGQSMFNGKKCYQYCSVRKTCFDIQGMVDF